MAVAERTRPSAASDRDGRSRILEAAIELFVEHGYDQVSARDLAAAARCSPANIYHHFGSKYGLFCTIIEEAMRLHLEGLRRARRDRPDPEAQLRAVLEHHLLLHMTHPEVRLLRADFYPLRGQQRERFIAERDLYEQGVRELVAEGGFGVRDARLAVKTALDACTGVDRWYRPDGGLGGDEVARRIADFLMDGFRGPARA